MSRAEARSSRARAGAAASAASPLRHAPLRKVVEESKWVSIGSPDVPDAMREVEVLECGHEQAPKHDLVGRTYATRRRCRQCGVQICAASGHEIDPAERGCRCGTAQSAFGHLWGRHRINPESLAGLSLAELQGLHDAAHYRNGVGPYVADDGHAHAETERGHVAWKVLARGKQSGPSLFC